MPRPVGPSTPRVAGAVWPAAEPCCASAGLTARTRTNRAASSESLCSRFIIGGRSRNASSRKNPPQQSNLDDEYCDQKSHPHRPTRFGGIFVGKEPPAKPANEKRHGNETGGRHAADIADKGGERRVERTEVRAKEAHLQHDDWVEP